MKKVILGATGSIGSALAKSLVKSGDEVHLVGRDEANLSSLANELEIGVNAGHDLSLQNIEFFAKNMPYLEEVSIGHALICESLYLGFENVIPMYLQRLSS